MNKNLLKTNNKLDRRLSIAPMMEWTDTNFRYFLRLISPNSLLYSVMITTGALVYGKKTEFLKYNDEEHPIALQLGGSSPKELSYCAKLAEEFKYDEVNLNCGCPSDRVQKGKIGACLMLEPKLVAECIDAMKQSVSIPVTVKNRIGVDDNDSYDFLSEFVGTVAEKGCETFIIHARKAILDGLSPAENRSIPPLQWDMAYKLKRDFPNLEIVLNGGISELFQIKEALDNLDGVMIGREAYKNPYFIAEVEKEIFGTKNIPTRDDTIKALIPYIEKHLAEGLPIKDITRHILGLYHCRKGGKKWRQVLSDDAYKEKAGIEVIYKALQYVSSDI